uniref:DUSP-like protein B n=1 Tax=Fredericella sultana TaxID=349672 RepID=J7PPZ8_9BILA|nr:DUSP-like protein B [Fredericella sultana]
MAQASEASLSSIGDGIYLGDAKAAFDYELLQSLGVTDIVNVTADVPNFYTSLFTYMRVPVEDTSSSNLKRYFVAVHAFIAQARQRGGAVLVHCRAGVSRSPTVVIAHLMLQNGWTSSRAIETVQKQRSIINPNPGFIQQLTELDQKLAPCARCGLTHKLRWLTPKPRR